MNPGLSGLGVFCTSARFGTPDDLRYLIDRCHTAGVRRHPRLGTGPLSQDDFALARFTGDAVYDTPTRASASTVNGDADLQLRAATKSAISAGETRCTGWRNFTSTACGSCRRIDAVSGLFANDGEWLPNQYGGRENIEAIEFLRHVNAVLLRARSPVH